MSNKPAIGITKPDNSDLMAFMAIWAGVTLAGGKPVMMTPSNHDSASANISGLILGGGKDIFPDLYNESPKEEYQYDTNRDEMEVLWAGRAINESIPALGICRGAQLMNVACGGTLHKNVAEAYDDAHYPDGFLHHAFYRKTIRLNKGTLLAKIIGKDDIKVNSIHKQSISVLGKDLEINASEDNGVIQAISHKSHPFFLGVQFHPEFLIYRRTFRNIFRTLIEKAK